MTTAGQLDSLLAWVRLHGGQISSKLRFSGPDGSLGAFADETLDGGEIGSSRVAFGPAFD